MIEVTIRLPDRHPETKSLPWHVERHGRLWIVTAGPGRVIRAMSPEVATWLLLRVEPHEGK